MQIGFGRSRTVFGAEYGYLKSLQADDLELYQRLHVFLVKQNGNPLANIQSCGTGGPIDLVDGAPRCRRQEDLSVADPSAG